MNSYIIGGILALNVAAVVLWQRRDKPEVKAEKKATIREYYQRVDSIRAIRDSLGKVYRSTTSETKRASILKKAKTVFLSGLKNDVFPQWYGTPWNFYGTTDTPGHGAIACGYFVTTSLRDMGVKLDRVELAECASETMIRKLIGKEYITPYREKTADEFVSTVAAKGDGLYIVGLDYHTGFLLCERGDAWFIHSFPPGVRKESPYEAPYLVNSKYRVTGCITDDTGFFKRWILQRSL